MLKFQQFKSALNVKHLFNALNMLSALQLTYMMCWAMSD